MSHDASIPPAKPAPKRKSRLKRWLLGTGITALVLVVAIAILVPVLAGSSWIKGKVVASIQENFTTPVTIEDLEFSWGDGVVVRGLRIENPPGFPEGPAVRVDRVDAGVSLRSLLTFGIKAKASIAQPEVFVHVREDGKINLVAMQKAPPSSPPPKGGEEKPSPSDEFKLQLRLEIKNGLVEIVDAKRGIAQRLQSIRVDLANDAYGAPIRLALDAELAQKGKAKSGALSAQGKIDINRAQPLDFFAFETTGLQLSDYAAVVDAFLPEAGFESFRGGIEGKLAAKPVEGTKQFAITGDLVVKDLDVRGGPIGKGRGIVAPQWTIRPNMKIDPTNMTGSIEGTDVDLGFATIRALSTGDASALLEGKDGAARALGLVVDLDLAKLGQQPLLPKGKYAGSVRIRVSAVPPPEGSKALPWGLAFEAKKLQVEGDFLSQPLHLDETLTLRSSGDADFATATPKANGRFEIRGAGLDGGGEFRVASDYEAKLALDLLAKPLVALFGGFLPKGLGLEGDGRVDMTVAGTLPSDARTGGLLAADLPRIDGNLSLPGVTWFGSKLLGLQQKIQLADGKLDLTTPEGATLNAGPLALQIHLKDLMSESQRVDFDISWTGGRANGGMTPALQYVLPLLAGLPTQDLTSLTGIEFDATTGLQIKGGGPLPTSGDEVLAALEKWSANGRMLLQNGSFSPSPVLAQIFRVFKNKDQSKITFSELNSKIRVQDGKVFTSGFEMGGSDGVIRLAGSTTLSGKLDVDIDLSDVLSRHRDGQAVLKLLGGKLSTKLAGTLWSPKMNLASTFENALKRAVENTVKDATKGALDDLLKGKKPDLNKIFGGIGGKKKN